MEYKTIRFTKKEGIAYIVGNRPEVFNIVSLQWLREFYDAIRRCGREDDIKVVIVTGEGKAFCAGGDVKEMKSFFDNPNKDVLDWWQEALPYANSIVMEMHYLKKPIIGAINGVAAGGGFSVAMACDILVASEKARFGWAYTAIGLPADMGASYFLPKLAGYHKAMELAFTSDVIDAQEALRLNLVNKVVPHESLMEEAERLAGRLATGALLAIGRVKELINLSYHNPLETQLQLEGEYQCYSAHTEDNKEGVAAFAEKRKPVFKGK
jgi:2-(1,2-epoxy-1,2-dihydrophenyl)acetyl-CoA isomerase